MAAHSLLCPLAGAALLVAVSTYADTQPAPATTQTPAAARSDTSETAQPRPEVLESFEVGNGVYVRSLRVDEANNSMWVGTHKPETKPETASANPGG